MDQIFDDIIQDKTKVKSVTYIPAGTRIIIFANQDMWLNSEKRYKQADKQRGKIGDSGDGLTTDRPEGSGMVGGDSYSPSGEYEEDIRPTGGRVRRNRNNNARRQRALPQNGEVPANIQQSEPISTPEDDDVPSLL